MSPIQHHTRAETAFASHSKYTAVQLRKELTAANFTYNACVQLYDHFQGIGGCAEQWQAPKNMPAEDALIWTHEIQVISS